MYALSLFFQRKGAVAFLIQQANQAAEVIIQRLPVGLRHPHARPYSLRVGLGAWPYQTDKEVAVGILHLEVLHRFYLYRALLIRYEIEFLPFVVKNDLAILGQRGADR